MSLTKILININDSADFLYVLIRSIILFSVSVLILRCGNRRYNLGTTFDYLSLVILGSLIGRGVNGALLSTLCAIITLILFHRILPWLAIIQKSMKNF